MLEYQRVERQMRTVLEMKLLKPLPTTNKNNLGKKIKPLLLGWSKHIW